MFNIKLSPYRPAGMAEVKLQVSVKGRTLVINGEELDFSFMPAGSELPANAVDNTWVIGDVICQEDDVIALALAVPVAADATQEQLFPEPVHTAEGADIQIIDALVPAFVPPAQPVVLQDEVPEDAN